MKNAILNLSVFACFCLFMVSCKKDPTLQEQLVGDWTSTQIRAGQDDITGSSNFNLLLQASDEFELDITSFVPITGNITQSFNGDWDVDESKQDLLLVYNGSEDSKTWEIVSISNTVLKAEFYDNNVRYQVTFQRQ